jgi:hypothetical protein
MGGSAQSLTSMSKAYQLVNRHVGYTWPDIRPKRVNQAQRRIGTDVASVIRRRLNELGIGQREPAIAAGVSESYISQLLTNTKAPPAADRTDTYDKIAKPLRLSSKKLSELAR